VATCSSVYVYCCPVYHWSLPLSDLGPHVETLCTSRQTKSSKPLRDRTLSLKETTPASLPSWNTYGMTQLLPFSTNCAIVQVNLQAWALWILAILGQLDGSARNWLPARRAPSSRAEHSQNVSTRPRAFIKGTLELRRVDFVRSSHRNSCKSLDKRFDSSHVLVRAQVFARVAKSTTSLLSRPFLCIN
jgi:hypothetical protein